MDAGGQPTDTNQKSVGRRISEALTASHFAYRRPTDTIYVTLGLLILIVTSVMILARQGWFENIDFSLFRFINSLPEFISSFLIVVMQLGSFAAVPFFAFLALLARRFALARNLALSGVVAWFLAKLFKALLGRGRPLDLLTDVIVRGGEATGLGFPSGHVTIATTLATVATPHLSRRLRQLAWLLVLLVALGRIFTGAHFPLDVVGGFGLGLFIGGIFNLLFGVPEEFVPQDAIAQAFQDYDLTVTQVNMLTQEARGSTPYLVQTENGQNYFVKVVGSEQRNADFMFKVWRSLIFEDTGQHTPFLTPQQQIQHEAFLNFTSRDHGVRTPAVEFTTDARDGYALMAQKQIEGRRLVDLESHEINHELLCQVWEQLRLLHEARIAHRDLNLSNIIIDQQGQPWIIDFGYASAGVDEDALQLDVAQMLSNLSYLVGVDKAVASAIHVLGPEPVGEALPALQPLALSSKTRELDSKQSFLDSLRHTVSQRTGYQTPAQDSQARIRSKKSLWVIGLIISLALGALLGQLLDQLVLGIILGLALSFTVATSLELKNRYGAT